MNLKKNLFIKKVLSLSFFIFINKPVGLLRDILKIRYFGIGLLGDSFSMAWRIPNMLRRIFGEGALAAALVPTLIKAENNNGKHELNATTTAIFLIMTLFVSVFCFFIAIFSQKIIYIVAPGALERIGMASSMLKILIFFTIFMCSSTVLGCTLQTINIFYIGPLSQFYLNIALCIEFSIAIYFNFSYIMICILTLSNGLIIFFIHFYLYKKKNFYFCMPTKNTYSYIKNFFSEVIPAFISAGITDLNILIDLAIASYLTVGSQSMLDCISGFVRIPLQTVGSAFATVSAPDFARIALKNPNRLSFYILESCKIMLYASILSILFFTFFSEKMLLTLLLSDKFTILHVKQGASLLIVFSYLIFFAAYNRVLLNVCYSFYEISMATRITLASSILNTLLNILLMNKFGLHGIVAATVIAEASRTFFLLYFIKRKFNIYLSYNKLLQFIIKIIKQIITAIIIFIIIFNFVKNILNTVFVNHENFINESLFFWVWTGPIFFATFLFLLKTKNLFKIRLFYI
jgi:putative peptidoglycan lipid II flippase